MAREATGEGFAYSLVDLMTSLVVIFVLLLIVFLRQASEEANAEAQGTEDARGLVKQRLEASLSALDKSIQVKFDRKDPLGLLVIVPEGLLGFREGRSELPDIGKDFLRGFAPTLAGVLCAKDLSGRVDSLIIEGHTNSRAPRAREDKGEATNIPLSTNRAATVMLESLTLLEGNAPDLTSCLLDLSSVSGRGPRDLIKDAEGNEDMEKSKRVEFKVRVRSIEQRRVANELHAEANVQPTPLP